MAVPPTCRDSISGGLASITEGRVGSRIAYGTLAKEWGDRAVRAVAGAIAANPIALLIPCHRIVNAGEWHWGVSMGSGTEAKLTGSGAAPASLV